MNRYRLTGEGLRVVREQAADEPWVEKKVYKLGKGCLERVGNILTHPVFRSMDDYIQHGITTCKAHCIRVPYMPFKIRKSRGWDYRSVARAGLFHDLFLYNWHTHVREMGKHFHGFTHPRRTTNDTVKYSRISGMERNLIPRHAQPLTPIPPRHIEGYMVLYADKFYGFAEVDINVKR